MMTTVTLIATSTVIQSTVILKSSLSSAEKTNSVVYEKNISNEGSLTVAL